jgi:hypothetical protein
MLLVECTCTLGTCICIFYFININKVCVSFFLFCCVLWYAGTPAYIIFLCTERSSLDFFLSKQIGTPNGTWFSSYLCCATWPSSSRSCLIRYTSGGHDGAIFDVILGLKAPNNSPKVALIMGHIPYFFFWCFTQAKDRYASFRRVEVASNGGPIFPLVMEFPSQVM